MLLLHQAPQNAIESCKLLFEFGAGARLLDLQSKSGSTALHMATEQKKIDVCTMLLEVGADRNLKDEDGKTAQDLCGKDKDMLELFKTEGKGKKKQAGSSWQQERGDLCTGETGWAGRRTL